MQQALPPAGESNAATVQAGSAFLPFVYAAGLEHGVHKTRSGPAAAVTPESVYDGNDGVPVTTPEGPYWDRSGKKVAAHNDGKKSYGQITLGQDHPGPGARPVREHAVHATRHGHRLGQGARDGGGRGAAPLQHGAADARAVHGQLHTERDPDGQRIRHVRRERDAHRAGFQAHHELTFKADRHGNWQLTRIRDIDDGYLAVNQVAKPAVAKPAVAAPDTAADAGPPEAARSVTTWPAPAKPKSFSATGYNYKAMAAYAAKYWNHYNPAYPNYNGEGAGGDCTNFVSQSLKAGGWKHVPGSTSDFHKWFGNAEIQSDSFVDVNEFSWFALSAKRVASLANVYQLDVGDVLQMDFNKDGSKDHSMIVAYRSPQGVLYVTYHSTNTYNRSVASIIASYPTAAYYAYRT
jgi:hypothetical protein